MDVLLSIVTGLGFRVFLGALDDALGRFGPALLGLWEGAAVYHLSHAHGPSSSDHYLAYALRVAVDFYFTGNLQRTLLVLVWTTLAMVASEAVSPARRHESRHRRRSSHSVPAHIRAYHPPPSISVDTPTPALRASTPPLRPSRPPTPPSFFLEGESDTNSNSPKPSIPKYLPSAFSSADSSEDSPVAIPVPLPTPPATLRTASHDAHDSDVPSRRRLSTIAELSSGEEGSRISYIGPPGGHSAFTKSAAPTYAPSTATTAPPLPVPNATMRYLPIDDPDDIYASASAPAPLPVPNPSSHFIQRPMTPSEPDDELQTPRGVATSTWELTDHDELMTPNPPPPKELLSPLFSDQNQFPDFAKVDEPPPPLVLPPVSEAIVPAPAPADPPPPGPSNTTPAVEYPSPTVVSAPSPNAVPKPEASDHETETASVASDITARSGSQMYAKAELLRNEAREAEAARVRLMEMMARAVGEARVRDVLVLREEMRVEEVRARKLHERAARRFFRARNTNASRKPQIIDVHGLRVAEAIHTTERALRDALDRGYPFVRVIVGKGLHSRNGQAVLKNAIVKTMLGLKIPCRVDPANAGVLIVSLAGI